MVEEATVLILWCYLADLLALISNRLAKFLATV